MTPRRLLTAIAATLIAACAPAQTVPVARSFSMLKASVAEAPTTHETRELRIEWTGGRSDAPDGRTMAGGTFRLAGQVRIPGLPRRERQAEPSVNDLVIVVQDSSGQDLDWRIVPNPLSGPTVERSAVEFLVYIPDLAGADRIQIFSAAREGTEYTLNPLAQLAIGSGR